MCQRKVRNLLAPIACIISLGFQPALAEIAEFPGQEIDEQSNFGPADFPSDIEEKMPSSYHDAWCKQLRKKCIVRFSGRSMKVDGYKGITREQFLGFRTALDGNERYFYVRYLNARKKPATALFLFVHHQAANEFGLALARWYDQDPRPVPNFRYPNSQGPQDTHGRDGGMNPYDQH